MAKSKKIVLELRRLESRTRALKLAERGAFFTFCLAIGFVVVATAFPQRRALDRLEVKLKAAKTLEEAVLADRDYHHIEHQALKEDPAFLEIHARDRLDYYVAGERVFKFKRGE